MLPPQKLPNGFSLPARGANEALSLEKWDRPAPRYTSYPTAPQFQAMEAEVAAKHLLAFASGTKPLSIYIHIPFCRTMCLFCGCSVVLNRKPEKQAAYLDLLLREVDLVAGTFGKKIRVSQLHFGGGTPTSLTEEEFEQLMSKLREAFHFEEDAELSIEIDPRTVYGDQGKKLRALKNLGFLRVSFGVQDLDPAVQEAVRRRQSEEMSVKTVELAREIGFSGINVDLIYGLPLQTVETFQKTAQKIALLRPDRISLFSYAKVPWLKPHQNAIREEDLPSAEEKFQIYLDAREIFLAAGYVSIGMDHFALPQDSLAEAYREGKLYRNFQGYSVEKAQDMIGLGITSIGYVEGAFLQNVKSIEEYRSRIERGLLPVMRGFVLSDEDLLRRGVIQEIMCRFQVDKGEFEKKYREPFDAHFADARGQIDELIAEGLVEETGAILRATETGRLLIRLVAQAFDAYKTGTYSRAI